MLHLIFKLILFYLAWRFISGFIKALRSPDKNSGPRSEYTGERARRPNSEQNSTDFSGGGKVFETDYRIVKKSDMTDVD